MTPPRGGFPPRPSTHPPALLPGSVHVWLGATDWEAPRVRAGMPDLSREELARAERFHFERDRIRFVAAHVTLRRLLGHYLRIAPAELRFAAGPAGKPFLTGEPGLAFNMSHAGDLALYAVALAGAIGVDIERVASGIEHDLIAAQVFSAAEQHALRGLAPEARATGFTHGWSRKEAYIKATGHGVSRGLDHFDVTLAPGEPASLLADRLEADAVEQWRMHALDPHPGYVGALVVDSSIDDVVLLRAG